MTLGNGAPHLWGKAYETPSLPLCSGLVPPLRGLVSKQATVIGRSHMPEVDLGCRS
jgi:hypothetical protein